MKNILIITLVALSLSSCNTLPFIKYYTTTKEGKFPNFNKNEYIAGSNNAFRSAYDITHYDLAIDIDPDKKYLIGSMTIQFKSTQKKIGRAHV